MKLNLRLRLLAGHILPVFLLIPLVGLALIYLLETRVFIPALASELIDQGLLIGRLAENTPEVWLNPNFAQGFLISLPFQRPTSVDLLSPENEVLATSRLNNFSAIGTTLTNLFGGSYSTVSVGLSFDFTFRNNAAQGNLAQTVVAERRLKLLQTQVEQAIAAQVRNGLQQLETARQRIAAADASARAAGEKLESETRLFQSGESTNFLVLTRQNEYADARHRLLVARLDFNKAIARLEVALGSTLQAHKIETAAKP